MIATVEPIVVACAADDFFAMPLAVTVGSALVNLSKDRKLCLYILDGGIRESNHRRITESLDPDRVAIHWVKPESRHLDAIAKRCENNYPISAYHRLLLPQLIPNNITRVIYLDSDLVVLGDLAELWEMEFGDHCMLAAQDAANRHLLFPEHLDHLHLDRDGVTDQDKYLQSGVLVIDLEKWRAQSITDDVVEFIATHPQLPFPDQDALNLVLIKKWGELDPRWNQLPVVHDFPSWQESPYTEQQFAATVNDPLIIHYGSRPKPWQRHCSHPQRARFYEYLDKTAWSGWRLTFLRHNVNLARRILRRGKRACMRFVDHWQHVEKA